MTKPKTSKSMLEVWKWKDACYRDVAHLSLGDGLARRIKDAKQAAESLPVQIPIASMKRHRIVAEPKSAYCADRGTGRAKLVKSRMKKIR